MADRITSRVGAYEGDFRVRLDEWREAWVMPVLKSIQIYCIDWESIIQKIREHDEQLGQGIQRFYDLTLKYNGRPGADSTELVSTTSSGSHQALC